MSPHQGALFLIAAVIFLVAVIAGWGWVALSLSDHFGWPDWLGFLLGFAPILIGLYFLFAFKLMEQS